MANVKEKHQLTEFIGRDRTMQYLCPAEGKWMDFREGDRLLLCTDGFFDFCLPGQIRQLLFKDMPPGEAVGQLLTLALQNGSDDNVTCAMICKMKI
jgi:protein phosphatase